MRTVKVKVYKFSELAKGVRDEIRYNYEIELHNDFVWHEQVYEDFVQIGKILGILIEKLSFDLVEDKLAIAGELVVKTEAVRQMKEYAPVDAYLNRLAESLTAAQMKVKMLHGFMINGFIEIENRYTTQLRLKRGRVAAADEIAELIIEFRMWMLKVLKQEWDHLTSNQSVAEHYEDEEFFDNGRIYNEEE